jgi:hypothetical protein
MDGDIGVEQEGHGSEARPLGQLLVVPALDGQRRRQGAKTFDHRRYGHRRRIDRHHGSGTDDHQLHVLPERDISGQSDRFAISASERTASGDSHFDLYVYTRIYSTTSQAHKHYTITPQEMGRIPMIMKLSLTLSGKQAQLKHSEQFLRCPKPR